MPSRHRIAAPLALVALFASLAPSRSEAGSLQHLMHRPPPTAPPEHDPNARRDDLGKPEWVTMQPPLEAVSASRAFREEQQEEAIRQKQAMANTFHSLAVASCYSDPDREVVNS